GQGFPPGPHGLHRSVRHPGGHLRRGIGAARNGTSARIGQGPGCGPKCPCFIDPLDLEENPMTSLTVNQEMLTLLKNVREAVEFRDSKGLVLGHFAPKSYTLKEV